MFLAGFCASISNEPFNPVTVDTRGCKDAVLTETHLTLAFPDRVESWDLQNKEKAPSWSMEIVSQAQNSGTLLVNIIRLLYIMKLKRLASNGTPAVKFLHCI